MGGKRRTRGGHSRQHPPPPPKQELGSGMHWGGWGGGGILCPPHQCWRWVPLCGCLATRHPPASRCHGNRAGEMPAHKVGGGGAQGCGVWHLEAWGGGEGGYTGTCAPGDAIPPDTHREGLRGGRVVRVPCPPPQNSLGPPPKSRAPPSPPQFRQQGPPRRRPPEVRKRPTSPTAAPGLLHRKPPRRHSCGKRGPATPNPPHGGPLCPPPCPYMGPHGGGRCYWAQLGPQYGTGQDWASAALGCWALVPHGLGAALLEGGGGKPRDPPELGRALPARP